MTADRSDDLLDLTAPEAEAELRRMSSAPEFAAPGRMRDLLVYLTARSLRGEAPKEVEIAADVFGKTHAAGAGDDAVARVYAHRLRKRLEDFYLRHPSPTGIRIVIPRGEYRLIATGSTVPETTPSAAPQRPSPGRRTGARLRTVATLAAIGAVIGLSIAVMMMSPARQELLNLRPWRQLAADTRPLRVVAGSYYIFGEYQDELLRRLIRDFSINSRDDLLTAQARRPDAYGAYGDVSLSYLSTASADALVLLAPVIASRPSVSTSLATELAVETLRTHDIIYVGLISGLGPLRSVAFRGSRFRPGESYDIVEDRKTGRRYVSEAFEATRGDGVYRDYALVMSLRGPAGGRIVIVAGARDGALKSAGEDLTDPAFLKTLAAMAGSSDDFEALLELRMQKGANLETRIVAASGVDSDAIWSGETIAPPFPRE
jgi:hypothetical protein